MLKRVLVIVLVLSVFGAAFAEQPSGKAKGKKFRVDELMILPHPGKLIKKGKISVTKEQQMRINKEVKAVYPPIFQEKIREAFRLEKQIQRGVAKGRTKAELKGLLDEVARLKREAMDSRIDALNKFREIVGAEKWKEINRLTYK